MGPGKGLMLRADSGSRDGTWGGKMLRVDDRMGPGEGRH